MEAVAILVSYFLLSNFVFVKSMANANMYISFLGPLLFGVISSWVFLYLFGHKDFFHFIKELEKAEKKSEKKYLKKFRHYGKMATCVLVSAIGGPIFLALTVRFLFLESENRYRIATVAIFVSTVAAVAIAKGVLGVLFR